MMWERAAIALSALMLAPFPTHADEPGTLGSRSGRVVVKRQVVSEYVAGPGLVPDCRETFNSTLLQCAPRVYVRPLDLATLNELNALPPRRVRPYPYIFSW
jgi:hypothetical protein